MFLGEKLKAHNGKFLAMEVGTPSSPDLNVCDIYLWSQIDVIALKRRHTSVKNLKVTIVSA